MPTRQALPRLWLMTDERADDRLIAALRWLPRGSGVVFRHHATPPAERAARYRLVRRIARQRGLLLLLADRPEQARRWRADGVHGRGRSRARAAGLLRSAPAHGFREMRAANRADLIFLSPVFATRSHPGAPTLGAMRFALLSRAARVPIIALGGVDHRTGRRLGALGAWGWAGIDAWA